MASQFIEMWKQAGRKINHAPFDISKRVTTGTPVSLIQPLAFTKAAVFNVSERNRPCKSNSNFSFGLVSKNARG